MLVSTKHKFVFLSNRKCASSSLVHSLRPFCSVAMDTDHRVRHTNYSEYQEYLLPYLRQKIGDEVMDYQVFCLFREPLDWIYSWYRFRCREAISPAAQPGHWEWAGDMSWPEYLAETMAKKPARCARIGVQSRFVTGLNGGQEGLTLFRFDELEAFIDHISGLVGHAVDLVHYNVSPTADAQPTDRDMKKVRRKLKEEFALYDAIPKRT